MADTYYDSSLTATQIENALKDINDVRKSDNNGKILCIIDSKVDAKDLSYFITNGDEVSY